MSVTVQRNVWEHSPAKGNTLLVELALAKHVIEKRVEAGLPAEAWPSQSTLAEMCRCSRSTVERALEELKKLDRIVDTGRREYRRHRGTVVYEFPMTHSGSPELTDSGSTVRNLTDSEQNLTDSAQELTDSAPLPASPMTHKQGSKQVVNPEDEQGPASPSARPDISLSDQKSQQHVEAGERDEALSALWEQLPTAKGPLREQTARTIARLEAETAPTVEHEIDMWASRLAVAA